MAQRPMLKSPVPGKAPGRLAAAALGLAALCLLAACSLVSGEPRPPATLPQSQSAAPPSPTAASSPGEEARQPALPATGVSEAGALETGLPLETGTPAPTPIYAEEGRPLSVAVPDWPTVLADSFDTNRSGWPLGVQESEAVERQEWRIREGKYHWQATAREGGLYWYAHPEMTPVSDFYLSAEARKVDAGDRPSAEYTYGLVFRLSEAGFYYFCIFEDRFNLYLYQAETAAWEALLDWRQSPALDPAAANTLAVLAQGPRLSLLLNGQPAAILEDGRLSQGMAGFGIELYYAGDSALFEFDDYLLRAPR